MQTLSVEESKRRLPELVSLAYDKGEHTPIARNGAPVAWIMGERFMHGLGEFFNDIAEHYPALTDAVALVADARLRAEIEHGRDEYQRGEGIPLESSLRDYC